MNKLKSKIIFLKAFLVTGLLILVSTIFYKSYVNASGTPASDTFTRTVSSGWGTADTGGTWTTTGTGISTSADFNVDGSSATASVTAANQNKTALLSSVSTQDLDAKVRVKVDKVATGSTEVIYLLGRHISNGNEYRGRMIFNTNNSVTIQATSLVGSTETTLGSPVTVSGLTYGADSYIYFRFQVSGTNPTTLSMKAWTDGGSEPGSFQYTTTDSASILQASGSAGLQARLSNAVSNAPVLFTFDDYALTDNDPSPSPSVSPSPSPTPFSSVSDTFTRSATSSWGTADTGGSYTLTGTASNFNVSGSEGTINGSTSGFSAYAMLNSVSMSDPDMKIKVKLDKVPTGTTSDAGTSLIARRVGSDEYRGRIKFTTSGTTTIIASKLVSGVETSIGSTVTVSGLVPTADTFVWVRFQVLGTNPTTLRMKAWADGGSEPGSWQYSATDSESGLQTSGFVGLRSSLTAGITNAPILFTYDSFTADATVPDPTPTAPPTFDLTGTVYEDLDGNGVQDIGENGYNGATVTLSGIGNQTTNSSGVYTFSSVNSSTYTVTLTLPSGYLSTTTNPVDIALTSNTTVNFGIQNASTSTVASDTFARSTSDSWGTADTGGAYTQLGTATAFSVDGSEGLMNMTGVGSANQRTMRLDSAKAQNINLTAKIKYDKLPDNTASNYIYLITRHVSSGNEYRGAIRFDGAGTIHLRSSKIVGGTETQLATETLASGVNYTAGNWLNVRVETINTNPTTLHIRVWPDDGSTEPTAWQYTTTDSASILQQSGSLGFLTRLGNVTNTPVTSSFDDLSASSSTIITPTPTASPSPTPTVTTPFDFNTNITKVFTIVMENQDWSSVEGNTSSAPYINSLLTGINSDNTFNSYHSDVAYAKNYKSVISGETVAGYLHPSEPNYIWMEAGTNAFSDTTFTSDNTPSTQSTTSTAHIATLLNTAGKSWRAYQENKPAGCPIGNDTLFIPRHSPFVYFQDVSSLSAPSGVGSPSSSSTYCQAHEFDFTQLATDLGNGGDGAGDYNFITPNLCNDMHDSICPGGLDKIKNGDTWLSGNLPTILNSDAYKSGHAVVFVVFDEDGGSTSNNPMGMITISPKSKGAGYHNNIAYSHSSYVKTIETIFGLSPLLGHAADSGTEDFSDLFGDPVIAAAGDIACGTGSGGASCQQSATADLIGGINPSVVLPLGDNQYEEGSLGDFQNFYNPTWGAYKTLTSPSVGNHEYLTSGATGYFDYFNGVSNQEGQAGNRSKGYYSYNVGNWHLIALNTNCSPAGGCGPGSPQETWLRSDLAANSNKCLLAYAHHPMFSSGQQPHNSGVDPLFQALYDYHTDVFLAGHDHNYERFYASNPTGLSDSNGITEFVVGTGGRNHTQLSSNGIAANSAVFDASTFGVLKMALHNSSFDWEFLPSASGGIFTNGTFTETGNTQCHFTGLSQSPSPSPSPSPTPVATYTISGHVYTDTNNNGVQDNSESGYAGATAILSGINGATTTSDSNGDFNFSNLGTGTYDVSVVLPTGYQATTNDPQPIALGSDTSINFGMIPISLGFQPTAPYYSTFYYNWFKNPTTDGSTQWGIWSDPDVGGPHNPPTNWFSNYIPESGLYSSNDYSIFKYEVGKIAQAKQEVTISSWWGQGDRSDVSFGHDITDYMNRPDNPYPNLRWSLYYECEGNSCNGNSNPSVSQITSDLNYIYTNYANEPGYLKVDGKPVIFVYAEPTDGGTSDNTCSDSSMTARWKKANSQAIGQFFVVLKVFAGYTSGTCQPDSWHQYAPAVRNDQQSTYSYMVSPGFWRSGDTPRLTRDLSAFTTAIQSMVSADTTWKLTETWNEWGEGSSVEPGTQVVQSNNNTAAAVDLNGVIFGDSFVSALSSYLPPLESGTGFQSSPTPTPPSTPQTYAINGNLFIDTDQDGQFDLGESGYVGGTVNLSGTESSQTTTDSDGAYEFSNLNTGTYTIGFSVPNGYIATSTNPVTTHITGDTTINLGIKQSVSPTPTPESNISISSVVANPTNNLAVVSWTTNAAADSEIYYGATSLYNIHLSSDIDGVTTHSINTQSLQPCTTYHFQVKSVDLNGYPVISDDNKFTTTGCPGSDNVISEASALIPFDVGGVLNHPDPSNTDGLRLTIPTSYDSTSSVFQSHQLPQSILSALHAPAGFAPIENYNYILSALPTTSTKIDSFQEPITLNITYSDFDLEGKDPGTLTVAHYDGNNWSTLSGCTINTTLHQITCTTTSFSVFSLVSIQLTAPTGSGVTSCSGIAPGGAPSLYQIDATSSSATLYFAPPQDPYTSYFVSYGQGNLDEGYGVQFDQSHSSGALVYKVNALSPNSRYSFKVRANNECNPGVWSRTIMIKTPKKGAKTQRFYANTKLPVSLPPVSALYSYPQNGKVNPKPKSSITSKLENTVNEIKDTIDSGGKEIIDNVTEAPKKAGSWITNLFNGLINYAKKIFKF